MQRALRHGQYKPGERLIAEDIAAEIGMSRMPVREAFRRLASEGLLVLRPNRGCIVAGVTVDELYEIFDMRSVLEGLAVRLAMPRTDEEELEELNRLLERMERAGKSGGSDWVIRHHMRIWFDDVEKPLSAREEHAAVIAALRSGDAAHAELVMSLSATIAGLTNWKLQAGCLACTYILFPTLAIGLFDISQAWFPAAIGVGFLYLGCLPSTVQSSVAFTSIAGGNVAGALCAASLSNLLGVVLCPLLLAAMLQTGGGAGNPGRRGLENCTANPSTILLGAIAAAAIGGLFEPE